jgi:hypothetical protein
MTPSRNPSVRRPDAFRCALAAALLSLVACGEEKKEEAPPPPPPPAPVETVKAETVEEVIVRLGVDKRVRMQESERPSTGDAAADQRQLETVLKFFDAMLNAKDDVVKPLLSKGDQATLEAMVRDGQWKALGTDVERVDVGCVGPEVLAVFFVGDSLQGQFWTVAPSKDNPDQLEFQSFAALPRMMDRVSGTTAEPRLKMWAAETRKFFDKGKEPDLPLESAQEDRSVKGEDPSQAGGGGGQPSKPKQ